MGIKYTWDGEKVKQTIETEEKKLTTMEVLNALANIDGQMNQMEGQKGQMTQQMAQLDKQLLEIRKAKKELTEFEEKCIELQKAKLEHYIAGFSDELKKKAQEQADSTISADPDAYNEMQKENIAYLNYQKLIATHEKVAKNISSQIINKYLYETPIFKNPFK